MTPRKGKVATSRPADWVVSDRYQSAPGHGIWKAGDMMTIRGQRGGRFILREHVTVPPLGRRPQREWISVLGGPPGEWMERAFRPGLIGKRLRPESLDEAMGRHRLAGHTGALADCPDHDCSELARKMRKEAARCR